MKYETVNMHDSVRVPRMRRPEKADRTRSRDSKHATIARNRARKGKASR